MDRSRRVLRAVTASIVALAVTGCSPQPSGPWRLLPAPASTSPVYFIDAAGHTVTMDRFAGRVVVLSLWAAWCEPCLRELPSLERLAVARSDIAVVAVNVEAKGRETAPTVAKDLGLDHLGAYYDPDGHLMRIFGARGIPATVVIDRMGRLAAMILGAADWMSDEARQVLKAAGDRRARRRSTSGRRVRRVARVA